MEKLPEEKQVWRKRDDTEKMYHDGDCAFWSFNICTCGLIDALRRIRKPDEQYDGDFAEDWGRHETMLNIIKQKHHDCDGDLFEEITPDEEPFDVEEYLDKVFDKADED